MIYYLKKLKASIIKSIKFYKNSDDKNFFQAISFFNLRFFYSSPFFRKFFKVKNNFPKENKKLCDDHFGLEIEQGTVINDLLESGISKKYLMDHSAIEKLINNYVINEKKIENLVSIKNRLKEKNYLNDLSYNNIQELVDVMQKNDISYIKYSDHDISSELKKLILSNSILGVVRKYLNYSKKILVNNEFVVSIKNQELNDMELKNNSAQFHRDLVSHNFLKVFIYLNDVNEFNGAHVYIKGSHKNNNIGDVLRYYSDNELAESNNNIEHIMGKKGSVFFEDTFGLHKGGVIRDGHRLMLILTYYTPMKHQLKRKNHYLIS